MRISDWSSDVCSSDLWPCCWLRYAGRVNSSVRFHWRDCMHLQGKKRTIPVAAAVLVSALLASCGGGGSASSSSAADCVINNVGSAQTEAAVFVIQRACPSKFPPSRTEIDASRAEHDARAQAQRAAMADAK